MSLPFPAGSEPTFHFDYSDGESFTSRDSNPIARQTPLPPASQSTIYYLIIKRPPIRVIDILGPFATHMGSIAELYKYLEKHYKDGLQKLEEKLSLVGVGSFVHIGITLTGAQLMDIYLHKEDNAAVKPFIRRQPVWTIICTEIEHNIATGQPATIKNREVLSTFANTAAGAKAAKDLARDTARAKIDGGTPPDGEIMWDVSGVYGVNDIYHVVGKDSGWSIEANLHSDVNIVFEGASDEFGRPTAEVMSSSPVLRQQYLDHQWLGLSDAG